MSKQRGFTLFEILIAVFIFAILGALAGLTLHSSIRTHDRLHIVDKELMHIQMSMLMFDRDVSQIINRPITMANEQTVPAVNSLGETGVAFTTFGHLNPDFVAKQSDLLRVAYVYDGGKVLRETWLALDFTQNTATPTKKVLFDHVTAFQMQFIDQQNRIVNYWPEMAQSYGGGAGSQQQSDPTLPKAIILTMKLKRWGLVQRVVNLPGARRAKEQTHG